MKAILFGFDNRTSARLISNLRLRWTDLETVLSHDSPKLADLASLSPDLLIVHVVSNQSIELIRRLRETSCAPIIGLGPSSQERWVDALEAGADECFSLRAGGPLIVARVSAALRRVKDVEMGNQLSLECGKLKIDPLSYEVSVNGRSVHLTPTEFKLLHHLMKSKGRLVTQEALWTVLWGPEGRYYAGSLRKYLQRLRDKLEPLDAFLGIETVPRVGYRIHEMTEAEQHTIL